MRLAVWALWCALQQDADVCSQFNKCHAAHEKEKIKCARCAKSLIPKNDAFCGPCAAKDSVCAHCGKPRAGQAKNIDEAAARITPDDLRTLLTWIAADDKKGRLAGSPEHHQVLDRYLQIYKDAGLKTQQQPIDVKGRPSRNLIATIEGEKKNEIILYGAHSDHIGLAGNGPPGQQKPGAGSDSIYNGADDNGSGSCTLVTIARILGESGLKPKRTIVFMNWTGEEWGRIGSKFHATNSPFPREHILAVLNSDMLGRYSLNQEVKIAGLATEAGNDWETIVQRCCDKAQVKCKLIDGPRINANGDSDHSSYVAVGIPALYWSTGLHADYHLPSDHADKVDYEGMSKIARAILLVLWELANSDKRWPFQK